MTAGRELVLFGLLPSALATMSTLGLVGGLFSTEWLVPVYMAGLIFSAAAVGMYLLAVLVRITVRLLAMIG